MAIDRVREGEGKPMMGVKHGTDHSTAGFSAERIGRNDAIFRQANERIIEAAELAQVEGLTPFICECADGGCTELVRMTLTAYSGIRQDARWFLNMPGHEAADQGWGRVIQRHKEYVVVEKTGPAGEVAEQLAGNPNPATAVTSSAATPGRPANPA